MEKNLIDSMDSLKKELDFLELEERLEMVQLSWTEAAKTACQPTPNTSCNNAPCSGGGGSGTA